MSDPISGASPAEETHPVDTTQGTPHAKVGIPKPNFGIRSMEHLREVDKDAYDALMKGLAQTIIDKSRKDSEKFKKVIKGQD